MYRYRSYRDTIVSNNLLMAYTVVAAVVLFVAAFFDKPTVIDESNESLLFNLISSIIPVNGIIPLIAAYLVNVGVAAAIYLANKKYIFIRRETEFPVFFIILLGGFHSFSLNADLYCLILVVIALIRFLDSYNKYNTTWHTAEIMMCLSTASIISISYSWYIWIFYIGLIIYKKLDLRNLFASLFGLALPPLIALQILYINGRTDIFLDHFSTMFALSAEWSYSVYDIIYAIATFAMLVISFAEFLIHSGNDKIQQRKSMFFMFMFGALVTGMFFFYPGSIDKQEYSYSLLSAICISHYFATNNSTFSKICFYVFSILILGTRIFEVFFS